MASSGKGETTYPQGQGGQSERDRNTHSKSTFRRGFSPAAKAEEYIKAGRITVNGHPAQIGHPVNPARDIIAIDGQRVQFARKKSNLYVLCSTSPGGYVTTMSDELGRRCVAELVENAPQRVYPVGRLDKDSEGLILLTNDGNFANTIMHPSNHIPKTYRVTVRPRPDRRPGGEALHRGDD